MLLFFILQGVVVDFVVVVVVVWFYVDMNGRLWLVPQIDLIRWGPTW